MQKNFLFVRHGETDWTLQDIPKGPINLSLNKKGREQAFNAYHIISEQTINNPIIFSSELHRAYETAKIFCDHFPSDLKINQSKGLNERYYGDYRNTITENIAEYIPTDIEEIESFKQRVKTTFNDILNKISDETPIIFSHQGVFECLTEWLIGKKMKLTNGEVCYFQYNVDAYTITRYH